MSLTEAGRDLMTACLVGQGTVLNETSAYMCVGDSSAVFESSQTDMQAEANKHRVLVDAGYPQLSGNTMTFKATFGPDDANFAWYEWGMANAAVGGSLLNRVVEYNGTKLQGQTWIFQVTISVEAS